ncbi:MAG: HD domain-containing phosphohydrolase [Actinomycetota bacterium]
MAWLQLDPALIRIGLFIKIDHPWMEHPFVRGTFMISSPTEIEIIRKQRLTKLFYDPVLSRADVIANLADLSFMVIPVELDAESVQDFESDEQSMRKEKAVHIKRVMDHRKAAEDAALDYTHVVNDCSVMIAMANAGQPESLALANTMMSSMIHLLSEESVALSLVCTVNPADVGQELAMQAVNVSALTFMTAKALKLSDQETQHVGMGALFHNIGQNRVPLSIRAKVDFLLPAEHKLVQMYPQFGKEILENIPGMPSEVIEIVYQHRECLDGTGFPKRMFNGEIKKLARLVGTVTEYNNLTRARNAANSMGPSQALSHIYSNMQHKFGTDVIEPFIAAVTVFPPGSFVELSDGSIGLVMQSNMKERMRPVIMQYERNASHSQAAMIDLARERSLTVQKSLDPKLVPGRVREALNPSEFNGYVVTSASA